MISRNLDRKKKIKIKIKIKIKDKNPSPPNSTPLPSSSPLQVACPNMICSNTPLGRRGKGKVASPTPL